MSWGHPARRGAWDLSYTTGGWARYRLAGTQITVSVGDLMLTHCDAPFEYAVPGPHPWAFHAVSFDPWPGWNPPAEFTVLATDIYRAHASLVHTRQRIEHAFRRLIADVRSRDAAEVLTTLRPPHADRPSSTADPRLGLARNAIDEILLLVSADAIETAQLDPRIVVALQIITADLAAAHDLGTLAKAACLSTSRFRHLFREQLGLPVRQAIRALRLQQAALRLAYGHEQVGTIAELLGFSSIFDFSRGFRRAYGVSPTAYRQRFGTPRISDFRRAAAPTQDRS